MEEKGGTVCRQSWQWPIMGKQQEHSEQNPANFYPKRALLKEVRGCKQTNVCPGLTILDEAKLMHVNTFWAFIFLSPKKSQWKCKSNLKQLRWWSHTMRLFYKYYKASL